MVYLIGIIIFFILVILGLSIRRKPSKTEIDMDYVQGLELVIDDELDEAEKKLKASFEKDTSNTGAYLYLGNILRKKGNVNAAIKIHKNLSVNPSLQQEYKWKVKEALAEDYIKSEKWEKALSLYENLYRISPKSNETKKRLLMLYEKVENWDEAYNIARRIYDNKKALANYATFIGSELIKKGNNNKASNFISIGIKSNISYAHYLNGYLLINEGNEKKGIEYIKKSISMEPDMAFLYLPEMSEIMFRRGEFSIIEPYLKKIHDENPANIDILDSYVTILKKKGDIDRAAEVLDDSIENIDIDDKDNLAQLAAAYNGVDIKKACELLSRMQDKLRKVRKYRCTECNSEKETFAWKCPDCHSFGTLHPVRYN